MALGIGLGQQPGRRERRLLADAGDDVGERPPLGIVHEDVVDREQRRAELSRQRRALGEPAAHVRAVSRTTRRSTAGRRTPRAVARGACPHPAPLPRAGEGSVPLLPLAGEGCPRATVSAGSTARRAPDEGHRNRLQPLRALQQLVETQMALAFRRAQVALAEQPAEPPVSGAVLRIDDHVGRAVDEGEPRPGDDAKRAERLAVLARVDMGAHHAGERVAVGDRRSRKARARRRARPAPPDATRRAGTKNSSSSPTRRSGARGGSSPFSPLAGGRWRASAG